MATILTRSMMRASARAFGARALLALGLVAVLGAATGCGGEAAPPPTGRVERSSVVTQVAASGTLSSITEKNLGFPRDGQLSEILVKIGDRVSPGQVLARIDDFLLRQTLLQEQTYLASQQAVLGRLVSSPLVEGEKDTLDQALQILVATEEQVKTQLAADASAVDQARRQWDFDTFLLSKAQDQLRADQASCAASSSGSISYTPPSTNSSARAGGPDSSVGVGPAEARVDNPVKAGPVSAGTAGSTTDSDGSGSTSSSGTSTTSTTTSTTTSSACDRIADDQQAVVDARRQVLLDKGTLSTAQQTLNVNRAAGQLTIENTRQNVISAQNDLASDVSDEPFNIEQQAALVAQCQAAVAYAQRDVDDTVLRSPVSGTVSVLNGAVGEYVEESSDVTPQAPGTTASIPGVTGYTSNSGASTGNAASGAERPGGLQFLVLNDVSTFQLVVPFEETDATKVAPNQKVDITFDAIPDLTRAGTVVSIAPTGATISSVINYYVTIVLNEADPRLKDGQTAQAGVTTNQVDDVLTVPNSAVRRRGGQSYVTTIDADGVQQEVRFQAGLMGDDRTQVISGLREGQLVVLREGV